MSQNEPSAGAIGRSDWWPCACMKRSKADRLTHIKLHHPSKKSCRVCGCTKAAADAMKAKDAALKLAQGGPKS